jgi:hypothetical protein
MRRSAGVRTVRNAGVLQGTIPKPKRKELLGSPEEGPLRLEDRKPPLRSASSRVANELLLHRERPGCRDGIPPRSARRAPPLEIPASARPRQPELRKAQVNIQQARLAQIGSAESAPQCQAEVIVAPPPRGWAESLECRPPLSLYNPAARTTTTRKVTARAISAARIRRNSSSGSTSRKWSGGCISSHCRRRDRRAGRDTPSFCAELNSRAIS